MTAERSSSRTPVIGQRARRTRRLAWSSALTASMSALALVFATPAWAGTNEVRTAYIGPRAAGYEWITHDLRADNYDNVYIRFERLPQPLFVKWVKCGQSTTQDAGSSTGGRAMKVTAEGIYQIGTNFSQNACVRVWARLVSDSSSRVSIPIEAYFAKQPRW